MAHEPSFFISYTETKAANLNTTQTLISEIKQELARRRFVILDPLKDVGNEGISDKVRESLDHSDCTIVDITTTSPNVMYETGYTQGTGKPCILLLDADAHKESGPRQELLAQYMTFLRQNQSRPLPADLGDVEYIEYSAADIAGETPQWKQRFTAVLDSLLMGSLSQTAVTLRRRASELLRISRDVLTEYRGSHPFHGLVSGLFSEIQTQYKATGHSVFQIDARYYQECLRFLRNLGPLRIRAIADLSESGAAETFWQQTPDPSTTSVSERIFLAPKEWFFDDAKGKSFEQFLREQARLYPVRYGHVDLFHAEQHPLGATAIGSHLLLIEPDLVGGYVETAGRTMLHIECNPVLYKKAEDFYERTRNRTTEYEEGTDTQQIRERWRVKERIGVWDPSWTDTRRDQFYYDRYDDHIRCWIMNYEQLIKLCAKRVQTQMAHLFSSSQGLRILEIGFGTGALTDHLMRWIANLNLAFRELGLRRPVERYLGMDPSVEMKEEFRRRNPGWSSDNMNSFVNDRFGDGRVQSLGGEQFHLVCGSLVLHDLVGTSSECNLEKVLAELSNALVPGGAAVFADIIPDSDPAVRHSELRSWKEWMLKTGMTQKNLQTFLDGNPEMLDAPCSDEVRAVALQVGFSDVTFFPINNRQHNPFKVFVATKPTEKRTRKSRVATK